MGAFRHFMEALLNPFFLVVLLFGFSLILFFRQGKTHFVATLFSLTFLLLLLFSFGWLPEKITTHLEAQHVVVKQIDPKIHWVVVFSGGQTEINDMPVNNLLNSASLKRLVEGVRLYKLLPQAKLILSGGGYGFEVPEAEHMLQLMPLFAIPRQDIVLEKNSINTAEQAKEIKKIVQEDPFYLVTSAIHMPRSMALCQAQGLHPIAAPTDYTFYWRDERWEKRYVPNPHNLFYLSISMHECLGRLWAKLHRNYRVY